MSLHGETKFSQDALSHSGGYLLAQCHPKTIYHPTLCLPRGSIDMKLGSKGSLVGCFMVYQPFLGHLTLN